MRMKYFYVFSLLQSQCNDSASESTLSTSVIKRIILLCSRCGPRLSAEAAEKLKNRYVLMRTGNREQEIEADKRSPIPITVR